MSANAFGKKGVLVLSWCDASFLVVYRGASTTCLVPGLQTRLRKNQSDRQQSPGSSDTLPSDR